MGAVIAVPIAITLQLLSLRPSDIIYWCKWIIAYCYIEVCKFKTKKRFDLYDMELQNDPVRTGFIAPPEEKILESPKKEMELLKSADEVFFYGVNSKSQYLVIRLARDLEHEAEAWIYLQMPNGKSYSLRQTSGHQQSGSDPRIFSCGGLQMRYLSPMRRWRIFFNGSLRECGEDSSSEKMVHVKFALLWRVSSDPFDFISDTNTGALAVALAKAKWDSMIPPLDRLHRALDFYAQAGIIMGIVTIEKEDHEIYLFGERIRFLGNIFFQNDAKMYHLMGQTPRNGRRTHIIEVSLKNVVEKLRFGYIVQPTGALAPISNSGIEALESLLHVNEDDQSVRAKFNADDDPYELEGKLEEKYRCQTAKNEVDLSLSCMDFKMNTIDGKGVVIKGRIIKPAKRTISKTSLQVAPPENLPLALHFSDKLCQDSSLTGGKGSSLGRLTELSRDLQNFIVPKGLVVTTAAYELFLTKKVRNEISNLEDVLYGKGSGDVKVCCQRVAEEIIESQIPDIIHQAIVVHLKKAFPDGKHIIKFAVRSSATGEDTEQLSAAGQMETYLGVTGLDEILRAVKKCWSSQFSYIAVQYKRQYGQIINSPMAVVIQKMIPCDVAGVLFTCDPLTGNPTVMSVTANYGLGETVVSGAEEPDTIEIQRSDDEKLCIKSKSIGSKSRRIVIKGDEGTDFEEVSEGERKACCMADEMVLRLGYIAIKIEKSYRSSRDIEWGYWNNNLYIFQSRPVTSDTNETDYEIDHEFDYAMRSENEYYSVCNVGEVMPGAMSTLGVEIMMKFFNIVFQRRSLSDWKLSIRAKYHSGGMNVMYNHCMFYALDLLEKINVNLKATEAGAIGLYGRIIKDEEMYDIARERHFKYKSKDSLAVHLRRFYRVLFGAKKKLAINQKKYAKYAVPVENFHTAQQLYDYLLLSCTDLCEAMACHMGCSESSSLWNIFAFQILRNSRGEIDADVYSDFSKLVTNSSGVESADVPSAIESLAYHISQDIKTEDFKRMDVDEAIKFLEASSSVSGISYRNFLKKHGHRCLKEFDIRSFTWASNPKSLILLLQNLVGSVNKDRSKKSSESFNDVISSMKIPLSKKSRLFLKLILPQSRKAVQNREASKSVLIRGVDAWRKGYAQLAKLMVFEGRIPEEDLLYFMTLDEIKELLSTRSPKIISKASHRKRRHPILDKYIFPEIKKGFPRPINIDDTPIVVNEDCFSMTGVPVSQGVAKGYVRVALDLEEASHLQPGEILVTYSTDIGWSPYFPILSGVVTELGGLISHGAVVSREYGIPCVAALHGATRQFQTGDYALLDGNKGILQKLPKPEDEDQA